MKSNDPVTEATAHTVLDYCMTMATIKNTNYKFTVQVPHESLAASAGLSAAEVAKYYGSALQIHTTLKWVEHDSENVNLDIEEPTYE